MFLYLENFLILYLFIILSTRFVLQNLFLRSLLFVKSIDSSNHFSSFLSVILDLNINKLFFCCDKKFGFLVNIIGNPIDSSIEKKTVIEYFHTLKGFQTNQIITSFLLRFFFLSKFIEQFSFQYLNSTHTLKCIN